MQWKKSIFLSFNKMQQCYYLRRDENMLLIR